MKLLILLITLFLTSAECFAQCQAFAGPNRSICLGGNAVIGATPAATGTGPFTYLWTPAAGLSCTTCPNPVASPIVTTTYNLQITDNTGCNDGDNVQVTVTALVNANFTFAPNNSCANTPVNFTNTSTGPGLTYLWNFGNPASGSANTSTSTNPAHTFVSEGNGSTIFNVTLTVTNASGCTDNVIIPVTIQNTPGPILIDPIDDMKNCAGTTFNMTVYDASSATGNTSFQIIWGDGSPNFSSTSFPGTGATHNYTTADIFDLLYIVTGANGCVDTALYNIANITNPAIGAANPGGTTGCGPLTLCFPLSNFITNHGSTYYVVNYGDGSPKDTLPHPPPAILCHTYSTTSCGLPGNSFTFKITAINRCDSSTATISPIRVYLGPVANFTVSMDPACVNTPITMINTSQTGFNSSCSGATIFNWNFGDGVSLTTFTLTNPIHAYTLPGTYTVTLSAQNGCGTTTQTRTVCVEIPPVPLFTLTPTTGCAPLISIVTNTSTTLNTCAVTRLWTVVYQGSTCLPSSGTFSFIGGTDNQSVNPQFQFNGPGVYVVRLTLTNSCGPAFVEQTVTVKGLPQVSILPLSSICEGNSIAPVASINNCYDPITAYNWNFTNGLPASSIVLNPGNVLFNTAGTFAINLSVTNSCGVANTTQNILVNPLPPNLNPTVTNNLCVGQTANFSANALAGVSYTWRDPSNVVVSNNQNFSITNVTLANAGTYTLTGSFGTCVGVAATVTLVITPLPIITVTASSTICAGTNITLTANGASTYTWTPITNLNVTVGAVVIANPTTTTTYTVVGNNGTCSGNAQTTVTIIPIPIVNAGIDTTVCNQAIPFNLSATPIGGTWTGSNVTPTGQFTPSGSGTFTLTYTYININGCTNTDTRDVTVINPTPANAGVDAVLCLDAANLTLTGSPIGGTWTGSGVTVAGIFDPTIVGLFDLVYTLGAGACLTTDTVKITVNPLPIVNAGIDFTQCISDAPSFLIGNPLGGTWSGIGITNPLGNFSPAIAGVGLPILTYSYLDLASGCANTDQLTATIIALPIVNAGNDTTVCNQPIPFNLIATPSGGTWSGSNVSVTGQFTPSGTGTFALTYTFTTVNGCTNSDVRNVTVINPTPANAGSDAALCIDAPNLTLSGTPVGGTWTGSGVSVGGIFDPTLAGAFNLVYTFGAGACLTRDTVQVTVNSLPVVSAGLDFAQCINAAPSILIGTPIGGTWSGLGITNPLGNFSPVLAGTGSHTLTYIYLDIVTGCSNIDVSFATINPLPIVNAGLDTTICNQPFPIQFYATPALGTWSGSGITATGIFTPGAVGSSPLTYSYTNATGCSNSDIRIVTVVAPIQPNAGLDFPICIDAPNAILVPIPTLGIWTGTDVTTTGIFNPTTAGNFPLVYSIGAGNCLRTDTLIVTVNPLPLVTTGPDLDFCPTDPIIDLPENPIGGTWAGSGITNVSTGTFNPFIAPVGTHNLTYTYTDPVTGCSNSDLMVANIHPTPVPIFTVAPIVCIGISESFTNTSLFGSTYAWNLGDNTTSTLVSPSHTYTTAGFYTTQLIVTSAFGCIDSISQPIEVRIPPTADFTLAPDSACGPVIVSFNNLSSGPSLTYAWNFGNGNTSIAQNPASQTYNQGVIADTSYSIILIVTNFCGSVSHTENVIAMPQPNAIFGTNTDVGCSPLNLQFNNISLGLPDSYTWDFGNGATGNNGLGLFTQQFVTGTSDTTFTIMLAVANECGVDTAYHTITVLPNIVNAFFNVNSPSGCVPHVVNFSQFSTGATFYSWNFGDGNVSTLASPSHTFTSPGVYTVYLYANDGCGYDTTSQQITVFPSPIVAFNSQPDSVCINAPFLFQNQSIGLANCTWSFGDGGSSVLFDPTHIYVTSGTFIVTLTGVGLTNGCSASISHSVVVSTNPVAQFTANPISGCEPLNVSFNNTSTNTNFQAWNFGDGNFSTSFSTNHTYTSAGTYIVNLNVENSNGCADSTAVVITVYPKPVAQFTTTSTDVCTPPVLLNTLNTSTGALNYDWTFGDGGVSNLTQPSHNYPVAGTYTIQLIASSLYGCKDTASQVLNVYDTPIASFTLPEDTVCAGENILFNSTSSFADSLTWNFGNGNIQIGNSVNYNYANSGNYIITLIANGPGGCADTLTIVQPIVVNPSPVADFEFENIQNPDPLSGIVAFTNTSINANSYWWTFGNGDTSSLVDPIERYNEFGDFDVTLIAYNQYGCVDTIRQTVNVDFFYGLYIPNAINPGHPEFEVSHFLPKGVGLQEYELLIYDDWGNLIWSTTALDADGRPTESWDGTFLGVPVQQDAYVWKVTATFMNFKVYEGKEYPKSNGKKRLKRSGSVTVIR